MRELTLMCGRRNTGRKQEILRDESYFHENSSFFFSASIETRTCCKFAKEFSFSLGLNIYCIRFFRNRFSFLVALPLLMLL